MPLDEPAGQHSVSILSLPTDSTSRRPGEWGRPFEASAVYFDGGVLDVESSRVKTKGPSVTSSSVAVAM